MRDSLPTQCAECTRSPGHRLRSAPLIVSAGHRVDGQAINGDAPTVGSGEFFVSAGHDINGHPVELPVNESPKTRLRVFWPVDAPQFMDPDQVTCVVVLFPSSLRKEV